MSRERPPGIFVVGTDTGVGKTRVAAAIARAWVRGGRRVGVVKPVSSGATPGPGGSLVSDDASRLATAITAEGSPFPPPPAERVGPIVLEAPLAPPVAARAAGATLSADAVASATEDALDWWAEVGGVDLLVVEGVGGLLCPLAEGGWTVADLAVRLDFPILVVAHRGLGTLNHTLLTVEAARSRGLRLAGIVLNAARAGDEVQAEGTNAAELARLLPEVPVLADWPHRPGPDSAGPDALGAGDWVDLARPPRPDPAPRIAPTSLGVLADSADDLPAGPDASLLLGSATTPDPDPAARIGPVYPPAGAVAAPAPASPPPASASRDDDPPRTSWSGVLLFGYATVATIALIWTLAQGRRERPGPAAVVEAPSDEAAPAPVAGRLAARSRVVAPPAPIPADRVIEPGRGRQVDSLQVEPIGADRQDLELTRTDVTGKAQRRAGPRRSLVLRVLLTNKSLDQVFAPVDPAFVRGGEGDQLETFLELEDGRRLYPIPLAVDSEWGLPGESFADLRPGESREVAFAVGPDAPDDALRVPATWRVKLRTGLDSTAAVGVRLPGNARP